MQVHELLISVSCTSKYKCCQHQTCTISTSNYLQLL